MRTIHVIAAGVAAVLTSLAATSVAQDTTGTQAPATPPPSAAATRTVVPPKLVKFVEAPYPEAEKANGQDVAVVLSIGIGADGKVVEVAVAQSGGAAFDAAARQAAQAFEFEPAEVDGVKVAVRIQYRYQFTLQPAVAAPIKTTADFDGVVRDRKTHAPLPGVSVEVDGASATTDETGHFHFADLPPGTHSVTLSGSAFTPTATEETLLAGQRYDATYDVDTTPQELAPGERVDFEMVIVDVPLVKSIASTTVSSEQGSRVAGTGGDVIKVVENLPGVARASVGSSALVVWGAAGEDTRIYVDDVHIPRLYHEGGFRSVIHSDLVKSVELEPGGYGAPHGRGLGGLVTVGLKPLEADGYHGSLSVDAIDAAASMRGNIGHDWRFAGAARRSHLDWVLQQATSKDVGEFVPIPRYWDSQLRAAYVPHEGESLEAGGLFSSDHISRSVLAADPNEIKSEGKDTSFNRFYLRYQKQMADGSTVTATPFLGFDQSQVSSIFGAVPAQLQNDATVYGLRTVWNGKPHEDIGVSTGIDIEAQTSTLRRNGSITTPPREGDLHVFGAPPSDQVNADTWNTTNVGLAPFVQADVALLGGDLHVIPGLRAEPSITRASRRVPSFGDIPPVGTMRETTGIEPRLAARWAITDHVAVRGAVGIYHQPPLAEDLSAVFGNPTLGEAKAVHYLLGSSVRVTDAINFEVTGFLSKQSDLATRSPLPTPIQSQALIQDGLGRAYGGQILLRHDLTHGFFGWLSYSLVRSERTDGNSRSYRLFDFDQTHVFTALGSYDLGAGFEFGARFRYSTGFPRTPVIGAVYDARRDAYEPIFGVHNSIRIPAFYEIDARVSKRFKLATDTELEVYLDVQNATNHANDEEIIYNFNFTKKSYITGLPVLPVLGAKLTW